MKVYHGTTTGRFNLFSNEKQQQVYLYTPAGNLSELWDENEADYDSNMLPSEVVEIIEKRLKAYWINTAREEKLVRISEIKKRIGEFDRLWLEGRIEGAEKSLSSLRNQLQDLIDTQADAEVQT